MAMRARSDSAPRRADGMRALPDSARQRPAGARARGDSARLRPAGARTQPDSPRAGIRPRRTPDQAPQRSDPPDPEEIARVQRLREQTIADLRSVLTPQQRIQFEKNLREMQAQSVRKRPG